MKQVPNRRQRSFGRSLLLRGLAILVGLAPLWICEIALRVGAWGAYSAGGDPYVEFAATHPLFVRSADGARFEIAASRQLFFCPDSFPVAKGDKDFRIFCLGGSTVQGRPFSIETSFGSWLELSLQAADSSRDWDVVNCGGVSYASYRLVPILSEVLRHEPDLVILCTGHNEFLEERTYRTAAQAPEWLASTHRTMTRLHT